VVSGTPYRERKVSKLSAIRGGQDGRASVCLDNVNLD